jgi:hypothetical protein
MAAELASAAINGSVTGFSKEESVRYQQWVCAEFIGAAEDLHVGRLDNHQHPKSIDGIGKGVCNNKRALNPRGIERLIQGTRTLKKGQTPFC